jgi:hypothetical protein
MRPLFFSVACDYCDGLALDESTCDRGFIVFHGGPLPADEYVFATREDAERWRALQGLADGEVLEVRAPFRFRWRTTQGSVKGIRMADGLVKVYADRRFQPAPNRAFLKGARST